MRIFRLVMLSLLLLTLIPLISIGAAEVMAHVYSCNLDLASAHPCMVGGEDIGEDLFTLGMMGWFLFATLPITLALAAFWIVVEIVRWVKVRRAVPQAP